ncbi:MAG: SNF2 helicase associated domain-containing protein, partial [Lentisphaeraceae bacterium]|nr:SNF2 helicase associated domain-containing protein [Lentisphaeraceae bacterium]
MSQEFIHPAELLRRQRQEDKRQKVYQKIATIKRESLTPPVEICGICFAVNLASSATQSCGVIESVAVDAAGKFTEAWSSRSTYLPSPAEKTLLQLLKSTESADEGIYFLDVEAIKTLLPTLCRLNKAAWRGDENSPLLSLKWISDSKWNLAIRQAEDDVEVFVKNTETSVKKEECSLLIPGIFILADGSSSFIDINPAVNAILKNGFEDDESTRQKQIKVLIEAACVELLNDDEKSESLINSRLIIRTARYKFHGHEQLHADLFFACGKMTFHESDEREVLYQSGGSKVIRRDKEQEESCRELMRKLGFRWTNDKREEKGWKLLPSKLDIAVRELVKAGWTVNARGKCYQPPQEYTINISSGHDWLGVKGAVQFAGGEVLMPDILKMYRAGNDFIELGDGSFGLLPLDWLANYTVLSELGHDENGEIMCSNSQATLLQALLDRQAKVTADEAYEKKLAELRQLDKMNA